LKLAGAEFYAKEEAALKKFPFIILLLLLALRSPAAGVAVDGNNNLTCTLQNKYGLTITNGLTVDLPSPVMLNYDNNGNLTNDGTRIFGYNTENQLTNVFVPGQWRSDFIYDGLGRRRIVREYEWSGSAWTKTNEVHIIYDGYLPIQERDSNNDVLVTYTRGLDLSDSLQGAGGIGGLLARTDANGSTFYHSDGAGNITALMDGQEDIVARYMYGPFGKLIGLWGSMAGANEMQFSSMPRDSLSGLSFYPFRAYEPNFQRWLNQDLIQEWGGINLYRFVKNNPSGWIDPIGLSGTTAAGAAQYMQETDTGAFSPPSPPDIEWAPGMEEPPLTLGQMMNDGPIEEDPLGDAMLGGLAGLFRDAGETGLLVGSKGGIAEGRAAYERAVKGLADKASKMRAAGECPETIARQLVKDRNALKQAFRQNASPDLLKQWEQRNIEKYGDPIGPTADQLHAQGKSWEYIIESATRPGGKDLGF
jgi:RHS repeat-associated protein